MEAQELLQEIARRKAAVERDMAEREPLYLLMRSDVYRTLRAHFLGANDSNPSRSMMIMGMYVDVNDDESVGMSDGIAVIPASTRERYTGRNWTDDGDPLPFDEVG